MSLPARVLFIDDDPASRRLVSTIVELLGYEFLSANDGESGLRAAEELHPDIILLDIMMPGISGEEAFHRLRRNPNTQHIPVIALTANSMAGDREHLLAQGFDEYIPKPVTRIMLRNILYRFLNND